MGRPPCCDKMNVKRGLWTPEEDAKMLAYVSTHGIGNWTTVPKKAGLNRCGKSCRLRWTNYLRPDLKHDSLTPQEEDLIVNLHQAVGSRWSLIAKWLPGRTDNDVKNHWNTKLRKKLQKMGIDPITHKPLSQIFSDYGNISSNPANPITSSFSNLSLNNTNLIPKPQTASSSVTSGNPWGNFVPQFEIPQPNLVTEAASSFSSSSIFSRSAIVASDWDELLVSDPVFEEQKQELDVSEVVGSCDYGNQMKSFTDQSSSSFVDIILDKDREMRSQFPPLLDSSFDY